MIVHLDADAFFASVEQAADPRLRGRPVAVGGGRRGIIASASYEARRLGIHTPMSAARARRLCPQLIVVPGDFEKYERFSRLMFSYAYDHTPLVEVASIDEGYFDLGPSGRHPAGEVAETIRNAIRQSLKISVSEGLAANKLVAQVASKLRKPAALIAVPAGTEADFLAPLHNHWLPGVGPKTGELLTRAGLDTIGRIAQTPAEQLELFVGAAAPLMVRHARGWDDRPVVPDQPEARSVSEQHTFEDDLTAEEPVLAALRGMAGRLFAGLRAGGLAARTLTLRLRYNDREEESLSLSLQEPTCLETDVLGLLPGLLRRAWRRRVSLRMVGVKLSRFYPGAAFGELELPPAPGLPSRAAQLRAAAAMDEIRRRFGPGAVVRGHDLPAAGPAGAGGPT